MSEGGGARGTTEPDEPRDASTYDELVFLGTATSEGVPRLSCLTARPSPTCEVCCDAASRADSRNRRSNTSLLVRRRRRYRQRAPTAVARGDAKRVVVDKNSERGDGTARQAGDDTVDAATTPSSSSSSSAAYSSSSPPPLLHGGRTHHEVLVDVGKYFYQTALRVFPACGLRHIDAVVLTHEHADACNGLDDLRDWTLNIGKHESVSPMQRFRQGGVPPTARLPVWADKRTIERIRHAFPYLYSASHATGSGMVPSLDFHEICAEQQFNPCAAMAVERIVNGGGGGGAQIDESECDLTLLPLKVEHGTDNSCLAYRFGNIVYMSDVSVVPARVKPYLRECELLIVDALAPGEHSRHVSHFCEQQALELVREVRPRRALFTGMTHLWEHERDNARLAAWSREFSRKLRARHGDDGPHVRVDVQLAHDGMRVPIVPPLRCVFNDDDYAVFAAAAASAAAANGVCE